MQNTTKGEDKDYIKTKFDQLAQDYEDVYLQSLEAKVFGYVTWKHLQRVFALYFILSL